MTSSTIGPDPWPQITKLVVSFAEIPGIRDKLPQMAQQLDVCQRALSDFLEDKRSSFPRCMRMRIRARSFPGAWKS